MGLLEKALEYKKEMNRKGHETLMDKIIGPAETDLITGISSEDNELSAVIAEEPVDSVITLNGKDEIVILDEDDLVEVRENGDPSYSVDDVLVSDELGEPVDKEAGYSESVIESDRADHSSLEEFAINEKELDGKEVRGRVIEDELFELPDDDLDVAGEDIAGKDAERGRTAIRVDDAGKDAVRERRFQSDLEMSMDILGPEDEPDLSADIKIETGSGRFDDETAPSAVISSRTTHSRLEEYVDEDRHDERDGSSLDEDEVMNGESSEMDEETRFDDYLLLYEIEKEIIKCTTKEELYDVILFSLMGQIGSTSSSVIVPESPDSSRWILPVSRGVTIDNRGLFFDKTEGILGEMHRVRRVLDLDTFKNNPVFQDDYLNYLAIDARYMAPILFRKNIIGAVLLGDKVSVEDYTEEEKAFIRIVCGTSGIVLNNIIEKERLNREIEFLKNDLSDIRHVDWLQEKIVNENSFDQISLTVRDEFENLGILSFAIFVQDRKDGSFFPYIVELEDFLSLQEDDFRLHAKTHLVRHLGRSEAPVIIDDFKNAGIINDVFDENRINKMALFRAYPFVMGNRLNGIIVIFRLRENIDFKKIDNRIKKISRFIFSYIEVIRESDSRGRKYIDNIEVIFFRISEELENASQLDIPVTFILFSIKNFKRYYNLFGYEESRNLLETFEKIVRSRLSDTDFSFRYGRNRFLLVLPGKDKKYSVPLANAIRNRVVESSSSNNIQLLVTFMIAEYPEDGTDLYSIMDSLE